MSHEPPDAGEFRVAYRGFLEELLRLAPSSLTGPPPWVDSLYNEPLEFPRELVGPEMARTRERFATMLGRFASLDRDARREIALSVVHGMFDLRSAAPPPPDPAYAPARPAAAAPAPPAPPRAAARPPAAAAPPPPAAAPAPPPAAPSAGSGLGDKLRSVFGGLRRAKPAPPPPPPPPESRTVEAPAAATRKAATRRGPPPPPPPPPATAAPQVPVPQMGGAAPVGGGTRDAEPRRGTRAKPPVHENEGGLLGIEPATAGAEPPEDVAAQPQAPQSQAAEPPEEPEARYLNAKIADRAPDAPLELTTSYVLEISVDLQEIVGAAAARMPDTNLVFRTDEQIVTLTVQVTSTDFDVGQDALPLKLPRRGPSKGKARFDITPKHDGRCALTVSVHKEGNFLMQLEVTYSVGATNAAPESVAVHGRPISASANMTRRELGMTISPSAKGGYDCIVRGPTHTSVVLPVSEAEIGDAIRVARDAMMSVVSQRDGAELVFQTGIAIDDASRDRALRTLAVAGAELFQRIFFGPAAAADVQQVGELLKKQATKPGTSLNFQVVATRFPVPWGLLYFGDTSDGAAIDPELFLGMRHVVEQIPLQTGMLVDDTVIDSGNPSLAVSVNVNTDIDSGKLSHDAVAKQLAFWEKFATSAGAKITVAPRRTRAELLAALRDGARDQLLYLYCHAITNAPGDPGGIRNAAFLLTGNERVTLGDLYRESPTTKPLPGNPLVFINACESAELRPEFYDGFIPYFMAKGARGVVGTECKTPAIFASEWALRFFPRFLDGEPLGDLFLELRREFHAKHGNPLGLLYNVYCDADTRIQPGLTT